jgi:hypothetical protein
MRKGLVKNSFFKLALASAIVLAARAQSPVNLTLTPIQPLVDPAGTDFPDDITPTPGSITFTDSNGNTAQISLQGPSSITATDQGNLYVLSPPNNSFTLSMSLNGLSGGSASLALASGTGSYGCTVNGTGPNTCSIGNIEKGQNQTIAIRMIARLIDVTATINISVLFQWTTAPGAPPPPASCSNVAFDHIEVVQVVQDMNNSLTLVGGQPTLAAGKPTVARVFLKLSDAPAQPVAGVTAILHGYMNNNELDHSPLGPFPKNASLTVQNVMPRDDTTKSLNFNLPDDWLADGQQVTLQADITVPPCDTRSAPLNFSGNTTVGFQNLRASGRTTFTIAWLPYNYAQGGTPIICPGNAATCPDESTIPTYDYTVKKLFPIAPDNINLVRLDLPKPSPVEVLKNDGDMYAFIATLKEFYLASEARFYDVFMAFLPSLPGSYGISEGIPGRVSLIAQSKLEGRALPVENLNSETRWNADTVAHELGHLLGRMHTNNQPCSNGQGSGDVAAGFLTNLLGGLFTDWPYKNANDQEVGFDLTTNQATPATYSELMSYCRQLGITRWISPFTYQKIVSIGMEPGGGPRPHAKTGSRLSTPAAASAGSAQVIVTGWAKSDGSAGALNPVYQVVSADVPPDSDPGGSHCIHFSGPSGALGDFCFSLYFQNVDTGAPLDTRTFRIQNPPTGRHDPHEPGDQWRGTRGAQRQCAAAHPHHYLAGAGRSVVTRFPNDYLVRIRPRRWSADLQHPLFVGRRPELAAHGNGLSLAAVHPRSLADCRWSERLLPGHGILRIQQHHCGRWTGEHSPNSVDCRLHGRTEILHSSQRRYPGSDLHPLESRWRSSPRDGL